MISWKTKSIQSATVTATNGRKHEPTRQQGCEINLPTQKSYRLLMVNEFLECCYSQAQSAIPLRGSSLVTRDCHSHSSARLTCFRRTWPQGDSQGEGWLKPPLPCGQTPWDAAQDIMKNLMHCVIQACYKSRQICFGNVLKAWPICSKLTLNTAFSSFPRIFIV